MHIFFFTVWKQSVQDEYSSCDILVGDISEKLKKNYIEKEKCSSGGTGVSKMIKMVESDGEESDNDELVFGNYIASKLQHINDVELNAL